MKAFSSIGILFQKLLAYIRKVYACKRRRMWCSARREGVCDPSIIGKFACWSCPYYHKFYSGKTKEVNGDTDASGLLDSSRREES